MYVCGGGGLASSPPPFVSFYRKARDKGMTTGDLFNYKKLKKKVVDVRIFKWCTYSTWLGGLLAIKVSGSMRFVIKDSGVNKRARGNTMGKRIFKEEKITTHFLVAF